jgi:hypothetical protein
MSQPIRLLQKSQLREGVIAANRDSEQSESADETKAASCQPTGYRRNRLGVIPKLFVISV